MDKIFTQKKSEEVNDVQEKLHLMDVLENFLTDVQDEPRENVVNTILNFSKALEIRKSKNIGCVEIILN